MVLLRFFFKKLLYIHLLLLILHAVVIFILLFCLTASFLYHFLLAFLFFTWLCFRFALMWFLCYLFHCFRGCVRGHSVPWYFTFFLDNKKCVYLSVHCLFQHPNKWLIPVFSSWIKLIISRGGWDPIFDKPTRAWRRSRYPSCVGHKRLSMYLNVIKLAVLFKTMHLFISCQVNFYVTWLWAQMKR